MHQHLCDRLPRTAVPVAHRVRVADEQYPVGFRGQQIRPSAFEHRARPFSNGNAFSGCTGLPVRVFGENFEST